MYVCVWTPYNTHRMQCWSSTHTHTNTQHSTAMYTHVMITYFKHGKYMGYTWIVHETNRQCVCVCAYCIDGNYSQLIVGSSTLGSQLDCFEIVAGEKERERERERERGGGKGEGRECVFILCV